MLNFVQKIEKAFAFVLLKLLARATDVAPGTLFERLFLFIKAINQAHPVIFFFAIKMMFQIIFSGNLKCDTPN